MKATAKQVMADIANHSKSRVWKQRWAFLSICLLAGMGVMLASCSEDLESALSGDDSVLVIEVSDETQIPQTRAEYAGLTTTFEVGDEIGIYAVNGTTAEYSNVKYTLTESGWVAASKVPSKAAYTFYAYYPYTDTPTSPNFSASGDEDAKFSPMIDAWEVSSDQGTLDKFRANDLMAAKGTRSGKVVSFTMKHKMALAVMNSETVTFSYSTDPTTTSNVAVSYAGMIPYFDGTNNYLFMKPDVLTTIGGQQLKAGSGKYISASGGELTESFTLSYSTDGGTTFSATPPSWLQNIEETRESNDEPVNFVVTVSDEKTTDIVTGTGEDITEKLYTSENLKSATPVSGYRDLSMYNNDGTYRGSMVTANCYLVHAPGTYRIPLLYGNSMKNGTMNANSFVSSNNSSKVLKNFLRHDDGEMIGGSIRSNNITVDGVELVWQDVKGLISNVAYDGGNYLLFTVSSSNIAAGNAVLAVKSGSTIVWSWHIWVTEETLSEESLTTIDTGDHVYKVAPCNVGWVPTFTDVYTPFTMFAGSSCIVKLTLTNGSAMTFTVTQPDHKSVSEPYLLSRGYSPFYQWGRKDPEVPSVSLEKPAYNHDTWDINGNKLTSSDNVNYSIVNTGNSIGETIQHPMTHFYNSDTKGPYNENYNNFWDANQTGYNNISTKTIKTVYDPCPPGFCVPTGNLFYYMTNVGRSRSDYGESKLFSIGRMWIYNGARLWFPFEHGRQSSNGRLSGRLQYNVNDEDPEATSSIWSASLDNSDDEYDSPLVLFFTNFSWDSYTDESRAAGLPIRPVAEE